MTPPRELAVLEKRLDAHWFTESHEKVISPARLRASVQRRARVYTDKGSVSRFSLVPFSPLPCLERMGATECLRVDITGFAVSGSYHAIDAPVAGIPHSGIRVHGWFTPQKKTISSGWVK